MLEYFPQQYTWNLAVNLALSTGAQAGDVDKACRRIVWSGAGSPLLPDVGPADLSAAWTDTAEDLRTLADIDRQAGHLLSAADKYRRASVMFLSAERLRPHGSPETATAYRDGVNCFQMSLTRDDRCTAVRVPYGNATLPALFVAGTADAVPGPCVVFLNGLDSTKEMCFGTTLPQELARRGISTLLLDQPGSGGALREQELTGLAEAEHYSTPALAYLAERPEIDPDRIGIVGWSLGGYFAPRAAAMEPRFAACVAWGAIYDWGELQRRRMDRENTGEQSVPHYWQHVQWVFGCSSREEFLEVASRMTLENVSEKIQSPLLIVHGTNDRQVPSEMAQRQYEAAIGTRERELVYVTDREGGVEHVGADNMRFSVCRIADWLADQLIGHERTPSEPSADNEDGGRR